MSMVAVGGRLVISWPQVSTITISWTGDPTQVAHMLCYMKLVCKPCLFSICPVL